MSILLKTNSSVETTKKVTLNVSGLGDDAIIHVSDLPKSLVDMAKYIQRSP